MKSEIGAALAAGLMLSAVAEDSTEVQLSLYASFDLASGYVLYGARENREPCYWTYGEGNLTLGDFGMLAVGLWQNTDMTAHRKETMRRMNEWDWGAYYRYSLALAEDWQLSLAAGHIWYVYHGLTPAAAPFYKTMEEWYARVQLDNPLVTPYLEGFYDHAVTQGTFVQGGLKRDVTLPAGLVLTPELTLGGGSRNYNACLYPPYDGSVGAGLTFVQASAQLAYWFNAHFGMHARVAYVTILDAEIRAAIDEGGGDAAKDFVWGNLGVEFAF